MDAREKFAARAAGQRIRGNLRDQAKPEALEDEKEQAMDGEKKPMIREASDLMIQAMKDLGAKKIDTKQAQAIAQLGMGVVQAANAEVQFIKAAKGLLPGGMFGDDVKRLEAEKKGS